MCEFFEFVFSGEICELAGCDLLTISPKLLEQLQSTHVKLPIKLSPENGKYNLFIFKNYIYTSFFLASQPLDGATLIRAGPKPK